MKFATITKSVVMGLSLLLATGAFAATKASLTLNNATSINGTKLKAGDWAEAVSQLQRELASFGYGLPITGHYDDATKQVVTAFQRHFRPALVDGVADVSTIETLRALLAQRIELRS